MARCRSTTAKSRSRASCSATEAPNTPSTAARVGCWTSKSCSATPASAARCTSWSARGSSTRCWPRVPRSDADSSKRRPASSSIANARRRRCASSRRCRSIWRGCTISPRSCVASSSHSAGRRRWHAELPPSRPMSVMPDCAYSPTTSSSTGARSSGRSTTRRRCSLVRATSKPRSTIDASTRRSWTRRCTPRARDSRRAQETWYHLSAVRERFRGTRHSRLSASDSSSRARERLDGRSPVELEGEAAQARARGAKPSHRPRDQPQPSD